MPYKFKYGNKEIQVSQLKDITWSNVLNKPSSFTPSSHSHDDRYFTESEINTKLSSKQNTISDSGWINATLTGNFKLYTTGATCKYRKFGNIVQIYGAVTPTTTLAFGSNQEYIIFTLPSKYRPNMIIDQTCEGSSGGYWVLRVQTDGTVRATRNRAYTAGWRNASPGDWLPFSLMFFV